MLDIPNRIYSALSAPKVTNVRGNTGLYPASASIVLDGKTYGACHRAEYYRWYRYAPTSESDPEGQLIMMSGESMHEMLVDYLRKATIDTDIMVLSAEQSFFDSKEMISGRIDILMKDLKTGRLHGCDIKSVGEYKAGLVIEQPAIEHILQCAVYLDQFNKSAALNGSRPVEDWIILYISRVDTYKLKKYAHGSMFKNLWQFSVDLTRGYITVTDQYGAQKEYPEITMEKIYERYATLLTKIKLKELPDRDYEAQYGEETIVGLHSGKKLNKAQTAAVKEWMDDGAKEGELDVELGDFNCKLCNWSALCWSAKPEDGPKAVPTLYNIKKELAIVRAPEEKSVDLI